MSYLELTAENIDDEHICCAFSDKKCVESYNLKKDWLRGEFKNGYRFYRLDERAKVFIEYGPSESAWVPIKAENLFNINYFWVSGKYKKSGYGKALLARVEAEAQEEGRDGLVTVSGKQKFHFMSDGKWFLRNGFEIVDETDSGFILLAKSLSGKYQSPEFPEAVKLGACPDKDGLVVYYSNRCPYAEYHVNNSLIQTSEKYNLPLKVFKLTSLEQARNAPSPATIFSLFKDGKFITTDLSICMENRFSKVFGGEKQ